ncbi:MAG: response regulator transcription factor [Oscillospiraceae bacterium]|nr:response regulator transcription factor [Oscillospiraceae bacterium]
MSAQSKILIVDDDPDIRQVLRLLLQGLYNVSEAADGAEAVRLIQEQKDTDLIILDVMMPGMDGYAACDALRAYTNAPVLFLTAKSAEADRISAYRSGGDDFLSKPFSQDELLAKVTSLLRRYKEYRGKPDAALAIENLEVDFAARTVVSNGQPVSLTDTEFSILEHLLRNRGTTVTAPELYEGVWKEKFLPGSGNTVMVHVLNLRRKIEENPSSPKIIRTVWGKGYQID